MNAETINRKVREGRMLLRMQERARVLRLQLAAEGITHNLEVDEIDCELKDWEWAADGTFPAGAD